MIRVNGEKAYVRTNSTTLSFGSKHGSFKGVATIGLSSGCGKKGTVDGMRSTSL